MPTDAESGRDEEEPAPVDELDEADGLEPVDELEEEPDDSLEPEPLGEGGPNTREAFEDDEDDEDDLLRP